MTSRPPLRSAVPHRHQGYPRDGAKSISIPRKKGSPLIATV